MYVYKYIINNFMLKLLTFLIMYLYTYMMSLSMPASVAVL